MTDQILKTPVLFLIFNRPLKTKSVFEKIKKVKPSKLYLAADGHRINKFGEDLICQECREIVLNGIDWPCEIKTLFRNENLGCGKAVSEAISWFFYQEEEGIIIEDDVLPDESFFYFAQELLIKYRTNNKILSISGSNLMGSWKANNQSYFFGTGGIWGWATWRRAWHLYDINMQGWQDPEMKKIIKKELITNEWYVYYYDMFEAAFTGKLDTWDVQWLYTILINNGKTINPCFNLTKNIGFDNKGTHTHNASDIIENLSLMAITFPLNHPKTNNIDKDFFKYMYNKIHLIKPNHLSLIECLKRIYSYIKRINFY